MNSTDDLLRQTLRSLGREVQVSDEEVAAARHRFEHLRARRARRRASVVALTAAAAVLGAVAGGLVVGSLGEPTTLPAAPADTGAVEPSPVRPSPEVTSEDLVGLWAIPDNGGWVWEFHADGTMGWANAREGRAYEESYFQVTDGMLDMGICVFEVRLEADGTMVGEAPGGDVAHPGCGWAPGETIMLFRVSPAGPVSGFAFEELVLADAAPPSQRDVSGVWWKEGSGQVLILGVEAGRLTYRLDDDGDALTAPDDSGVASLDPRGTLSLTSGPLAAGGVAPECAPGATATMTDLVAGTYDSRLWSTPLWVLDATGAGQGCSAHEDLGGVWLRVP